MKKVITLKQLARLVKEGVTPEDPDYEQKRALGEKHLNKATLSLSQAITSLQMAMENLPHGEEYDGILYQMKRLKFDLDDMINGGVL